MKKIAAILPALLVWASAPAQNGLHQSVEVSNDFKTQMADLQKGELPLSIPDSLQEFDYHFDYSVFDSPYKGAYEFSPYFIKMTPEKSVYDGKTFWLRAGAGYTLHPMLDFVWTPVRNAKTGITFYNNGAAYIGNYTLIGNGGGEYSGYDIGDDLRFRADFIGDGFYSRLSGGWQGIFARTIGDVNAYNSFDIDLNVKSRTNNPSYFYYDFDLGYKYSNDNLQSAGSYNGNLISLKGCVGPVVKSTFRFLVDFEGDLELMKNNKVSSGNYTHFLLSATPHLVFDLGPVHLDAGVVVDYSHTVRDLFSLSPAITASFSFVKDIVDFYAGFVGGQKMHTYESLKNSNHFDYGMVPEASQTRYDVFGGFKGVVGEHFDYDIKAGYKVVDNSLVDYMTIQYGDASKMYINFAVAWRGDDFDFDGNVTVNPIRNLYSGIGFQSPLYEGDIRALYNWNKRIYAGATLKMMSSRKCNDGVVKSIPWYISPGVMAEYKFSRSFGVWAEGGNLLGHTVYNVAGYMMKGAYFNVGISCCL